MSVSQPEELHLGSHAHYGTRGVCLEEMPRAARRGVSGALADRVRRTGDLDMLPAIPFSGSNAWVLAKARGWGT